MHSLISALKELERLGKLRGEDRLEVLLVRDPRKESRFIAYIQQESRKFIYDSEDNLILEVVSEVNSRTPTRVKGKEIEYENMRLNFEERRDLDQYVFLKNLVLFGLSEEKTRKDPDVGYFL